MNKSLQVVLCLLVTLVLLPGVLSAQKKIKLFINGKPVLHTVREPLNFGRSSGACSRQVNRSIDGTCNNLTNNVTCEYGATDIPLERLFQNAYGDNLNTMAGANWPNPRQISNIVVDQTADIPSSKNLSSMVFTWGQFLDHDISISPAGGTESADVNLPNNESTFVSPIEFSRSLVYPGTGTISERKQTNLITAWIDASNVYGSDLNRANWLRTFNRGKLKTSSGDLLPYNTTNGQQTGTIDPAAPEMAGEDHNLIKYIAGDVRASEQPGLTSLHTIFVREHNRLCDLFYASGMTNDELIYQKARKMVGAYMQKITFEDFLPALGLDIGTYTGYDATINPNIFNEFSTAAYRIGHTMVTENMILADNSGNTTSTLPLLTAFFNPSILANNGVEPVLMGLMHQTQQEVDPFIVSSLRNFLFPVPGSPNAFGLDLATLNLQRGRDHGLVDYMSARAALSCDPITSFSQINSDPAISSKLAQAYNNNLNNIDLWVGLLAEEKLKGSSFGHTMSQILYRQFASLRDGDFYYFENDPALSNNEKNQIRNTTLRAIIMRNSTISNVSSSVFYN